MRRRANQDNGVHDCEKLKRPHTTFLSLASLLGLRPTIKITGAARWRSPS